MKAVMQTQFGEPFGNCWQACIASVLEVPIEEIPPPHESWPRTWDAVLRWLIDRGLSIFIADLSDAFLKEADWPAGIYVVTGQAARGVDHAVVYKAGQMIHDPHPDGVGLARPKRIELFYPLDPAGALM